MNVLDATRAWMRAQCPLINRQDLFNANYLGAEPTEYTLRTASESHRTDVLGYDLADYNLTFVAQLPFGRELKPNLDAADFFAALSAWVRGQEFAIRSDYRAVLDAISALRDPELSPQEQTLACLEILYPDWKRLPDLSAAAQAAMVFINCGKPVEAAVPKTALVDWDTDAAIMAPAVDKVLGYSCRRCAYLHWWEFIGAFGCIGDGQFAQVISIRNKRLHGKKLDKAEQEFVRNNPDLVTLPKHKLTSEEEEFFKSLGV